MLYSTVVFPKRYVILLFSYKEEQLIYIPIPYGSFAILLNYPS
jgi:hypothetical protein